MRFNAAATEIDGRFARLPSGRGRESRRRGRDRYECASGLVRLSSARFHVLDECTVPRNHAYQATPAKDCITIQHDFATVRVLAPALAELATPPTVRHHAERSAAMITDLTRLHHTPRRAVLILDRRHDALARSLSAEMASLQ